MTTEADRDTRIISLEMTLDEIGVLLSACDARTDYLAKNQSKDHNPDWWQPRIDMVRAVKKMVLDAYGNSLPSEFSGWDSLPAYYQRKGVENA